MNVFLMYVIILEQLLTNVTKIILSIILVFLMNFNYLLVDIENQDYF